MTKIVTIDAKGMHYTPLNRQIREAVGNGAREIVVNGVLGQRFIGSGLRGDATLHIYGVPGGDLAMFMSGPTIIVHGNAEHAPGARWTWKVVITAARCHGASMRAVILS